jgi:hypothetical protein
LFVLEAAEISVTVARNWVIIWLWFCARRCIDHGAFCVVEKMIGNDIVVLLGSKFAIPSLKTSPRFLKWRVAMVMRIRLVLL